MASNRTPWQGRPDQSPGIYCDECRMFIRGTRFKCTICPDYDLCSFCEGQGKHLEHDMTEVSVPVVRPAQSQGMLHPGIYYDGCGVNIRGIHFKCWFCPEYYICSVCEGNGFHQEHDMTETKSPVSHYSQPNPEQSQGELHSGIWCDGCGVDIRGIRFKCCICPDYDLCSFCEGNGLHQEHMTEILNPAVRPAQLQVLHEGVWCDGCGVDIRGIRFKCRICPEYDLCSFCEGKGIHQKHDMTEINNLVPAQSQVLHSGVWCDGCNVNIRGIRFKCRICPDYELCSFCEGKGIHQNHGEELQQLGSIASSKRNGQGRKVWPEHVQREKRYYLPLKR